MWREDRRVYIEHVSGIVGRGDLVKAAAGKVWNYDRGSSEGGREVGRVSDRMHPQCSLGRWGRDHASVFPVSGDLPVLPPFCSPVCCPDAGCALVTRGEDPGVLSASSGFMSARALETISLREMIHTLVGHSPKRIRV